MTQNINFAPLVSACLRSSSNSLRPLIEVFRIIQPPEEVIEELNTILTSLECMDKLLFSTTKPSEEGEEQVPSEEPNLNSAGKEASNG